MKAFALALILVALYAYHTSAEHRRQRQYFATVAAQVLTVPRRNAADWSLQ